MGQLLQQYNCQAGKVRVNIKSLSLCIVLIILKNNVSGCSVLEILEQTTRKALSRIILEKSVAHGF